jgi:hypothetical protein
MKRLVPILAFAAAAGCGKNEETSMTRAQLLDPASCASCHPKQYADWAGSMHAYASHDPVFLAMNKRGQRETSGALGDFCIKCHAPLALREGKTTDGLNIESLAQPYRGVTCFFCHSIEAVQGEHSNPLVLAKDGALRGSFADPVAKNRTHAAKYSPHLDRDQLESAVACGACHDFTSPHGALVERSFSEWKESVFSRSGGVTCAQCHMQQSAVPEPVADVAGAPLRRNHRHSFPAVDIALTDFPDRVRQRAEVQALLDSTLQSALCLQTLGGGSKISVILDNVAAGHAFPSGASQDRRLWVEVVGYSGADAKYSSGVVADGQPVVSLADPDLWLIRDCIFDPAGKETHMFWEAASIDSNLLPFHVTADPADPRFYQTHKVKQYPASGATLPFIPDKVTARVRLRPLGLEIIDDLIKTGDLDPSIRSTLPTFDVGAMLEWTKATANASYLDRITGQQVLCITTTNLNVQADKFPAPAHQRCAP